MDENLRKISVVFAELGVEGFGPRAEENLAAKWAISALAFAAFAVGSTEFVVVGLVPQISSGLGVSVYAAGLLVSLYALTIVVATPIASAMTGHMPRRGLLLAVMLAFTVTNLAAALAPSYSLLLLARILMGVAHGLFFGVSSMVASLIAPRGKSGAAVAAVMGGVTIAMVLGVPLGTWLGLLLGRRAPFFAITVIALVGTLALYIALPRVADKIDPVSFRNQFAVLANRRFAFLYLTTTAAIAATLVVFTYLSPMLADVTGLSQGTVGWALMVFGGATVAGNFMGGALTDGLGPRRAMIVVLVELLIALGVVGLTLYSPSLIFVGLFMLGAFGFSIPSIMQTAVVETAMRHAPAAVGTASGFNTASINLGIALGSFLGGLFLRQGLLAMTPYLGILLAFCALAIVFTTMAAVPAHSHEDATAE